MADIFISYSKADRALALKLSAFLEAEGWSVWWDKNLGPADLYMIGVGVAGARVEQDAQTVTIEHQPGQK